MEWQSTRYELDNEHWTDLVERVPELRMSSPPAPPLLQPSFLKGRPASGSYVMSLFPDEDVLTKEIESWIGFVDSLPVEEDRTDFVRMLNDCYKYSKAINAKGRPFPTEPLIMALLF